jgi:hypothetical protein
MAGLAHLGVGLAAKPLAPQVNVGYLILGAYALDVVWFGCYLAGLEAFPRGSAPAPPAMYSHSLVMGSFWSIIFGAIAGWFAKSRRTGAVFALVVFSHWVVDFISHPMTAIFPGDTGLPLAFQGSRLIGIGLYRDRLVLNLCEYGSFAAGLAIYVWTRLVMRKGQHAVNASPRVS